MNKFTLGAMTGMASLALAVPILAQVSAAQRPHRLYKLLSPKHRDQLWPKVQNHD
jgi:hypothetical protein